MLVEIGSNIACLGTPETAGEPQFAGVGALLVTSAGMFAHAKCRIDMPAVVSHKST